MGHIVEILAPIADYGMPGDLVELRDEDAHHIEAGNARYLDDDARAQFEADHAPVDAATSAPSLMVVDSPNARVHALIEDGKVVTCPLIDPETAGAAWENRHLVNVHEQNPWPESGWHHEGEDKFHAPEPDCCPIALR